MDWDTASKELRKPLDPKNVKKAPRGKYGSYVNGYHVVAEANRIFGEDGWSYAITRMEKVSEQTVTLQGDNGPYEQFRVGYLATVRVEVCGTFKEGSAVGSGVGSPNTIADHHESAVKEAETDALKRALRTYGNTFGLALYEKEQSNVRPPDPERNPSEVMNALIAVVNKRTTMGDLMVALKSDKFTAPEKWLSDNHPEHSAQLDVAITARRQALDPAHQAPPPVQVNGQHDRSIADEIGDEIPY